MSDLPTKQVDQREPNLDCIRAPQYVDLMNPDDSDVEGDSWFGAFPHSTLFLSSKMQHNPPSSDTATQSNLPAVRRSYRGLWRSESVLSWIKNDATGFCLCQRRQHHKGTRTRVPRENDKGKGRRTLFVVRILRSTSKHRRRCRCRCRERVAGKEDQIYLEPVRCHRRTMPKGLGQRERCL